MTTTDGRILITYRKVFEDDKFVVGLRWDLGRWTVESREKRNERVTVASFSVEAMDRIVDAWPQMKEDAAGG